MEAACLTEAENRRRLDAGERNQRHGSSPVTGTAGSEALAVERRRHSRTSYLAGKGRAERVESERWKSFDYDLLVTRDKANLDITWLRDESLEDADNLPAPEVIAREIVEDLTAALVEFEAVAAALEASSADS